jgi:mannose-6-phosphate isomerase-like protein (cupin superfamily)
MPALRISKGDPMIQGKAWGTTEEVFKTADISIHDLRIRAGGFCSEHRHRAKHNWFFVFEGHLEILSWQPSGKADLTLLGPGQGTTIKAGIWHRFKALTETRALELYWTELDPDDIERRTEGGPEEENAPGCPRNADLPGHDPGSGALYVKKEAAAGSGKGGDSPGGQR